MSTSPAGATRYPKWVVGYYAGYQRALMPPAEIDWGAMTHIAVTRLIPRANGSLDTSFDIDDVHGPAMATDLARRARAHNVVPILMVGGAGTHDQFLAAARDHRLAFKQNLLAAMRQYGYQGFSIDWEPINASDAATLIRLVRDLRAAAPHIVLTLPAPWVTTNFPDVPAFFATLSSYVNRIEVMTYGMAGAWGRLA